MSLETFQETERLLEIIGNKYDLLAEHMEGVGPNIDARDAIGGAIFDGEMSLAAKEQRRKALTQELTQLDDSITATREMNTRRKQLLRDAEQSIETHRPGYALVISDMREALVSLFRSKTLYRDIGPKTWSRIFRLLTALETNRLVGTDDPDLVLLRDEIETLMILHQLHDPAITTYETPHEAEAKTAACIGPAAIERHKQPRLPCKIDFTFWKKDANRIIDLAEQSEFSINMAKFDPAKRARNTILLGAEHGGILRGFTFIEMIKGEIFINEFIVDRNCREAHVGRQMMEHIIKLGQKQKRTFIRVVTRESAAIARIFFQNLQFRFKRNLPKYFDDTDEDGYEWELTVPEPEAVSSSVEQLTSEFR